MTSRSLVCENHLKSLMSIKDVANADPKKVLDILDQVTGWSKLLKSAKSDPDEVPFLHSLAVAICLANDEKSLERSPSVSMKSLTNFYEKVDQDLDANFLPYLKPLTDRINGRDTDSVDIEDDDEDRPTQLTVTVDDLKELTSSVDETTRQTLMKFIKSPAVRSKKRRATAQDRSERAVPPNPASRPSPRATSDNARDASAEADHERMRAVMNLMGSQDSSQRSAELHQPSQVSQPFPGSQGPFPTQPQSMFYGGQDLPQYAPTDVRPPQSTPVWPSRNGGLWVSPPNQYCQPQWSNPWPYPAPS